jgi:hypothetical protein
MSWRTCINREIPCTCASLGFRRSMICLAEAARSFPGLQVDHHPALVHSRIGADPVIDVVDIRVGHDSAAQPLDAICHCCKGGVGRGLGHSEDQAGILLGGKPFRHDRVAIDRGCQCRDRNRQGYRRMAQDRAGRDRKSATSNRKRARTCDRGVRAPRGGDAGSASRTSSA